MTTPTADAIRLAVKLSGHTSCELAFRKGSRALAPEIPELDICDGCLGDAATIDRELLLPQKHCALMAAQAVVDARNGHSAAWYENTMTAIDELGDALAQIKTNNT